MHKYAILLHNYAFNVRFPRKNKIIDARFLLHHQICSLIVGKNRVKLPREYLACTSFRNIRCFMRRCLLSLYRHHPFGNCLWNVEVRRKNVSCHPKSEIIQEQPPFYDDCSCKCEIINSSFHFQYLATECTINGCSIDNIDSSGNSTNIKCYCCRRFIGRCNYYAIH